MSHTIIVITPSNYSFRKIWLSSLQLGGGEEREAICRGTERYWKRHTFFSTINFFTEEVVLAWMFKNGSNKSIPIGKDFSCNSLTFSYSNAFYSVNLFNFISSHSEIQICSTHEIYRIFFFTLLFLQQSTFRTPVFTTLVILKCWEVPNSNVI